jgi:hypothetical protein
MERRTAKEIIVLLLFALAVLAIIYAGLKVLV